MSIPLSLKLFWAFQAHVESYDLTFPLLITLPTVSNKTYHYTEPLQKIQPPLTIPYIF